MIISPDDGLDAISRKWEKYQDPQFTLHRKMFSAKKFLALLLVYRRSAGISNVVWALAPSFTATATESALLLLRY